LGVRGLFATPAALRPAATAALRTTAAAATTLLGRRRFRRRGAALADGVGHLAQDQLDGADAVVVAGDRQVHRVRVAVGVDQRQRGHAHALRLLDGDVLA